MKELIERIEGAEGPGRGPILDAFYYIHPQLYSNQPGYSDWFYTHEAFVRKLDAGAYLDAALSLVPEGCKWQVSTEEPGPWAWVGRPGSDIPAIMAATPALALCAAALRAIGDTHDD